jgi:hypothetical protein
MNVGPLMKSQSLAIWLMMSGLGSLFVLLVTKSTEELAAFNELTSERALKNPDHGISLPMKYLFFTAVAVVANIWFVLWAKYVFKYKDATCSMTKVGQNGDKEESIDAERLALPSHSPEGQRKHLKKSYN